MPVMGEGKPTKSMPMKSESTTDIKSSTHMVHAINQVIKKMVSAPDGFPFQNKCTNEKAAHSQMPCKLGRNISQGSEQRTFFFFLNAGLPSAQVINSIARKPLIHMV